MAKSPPINVPPTLKFGSCLASNRVQNFDEEENASAIRNRPLPKFGEWDVNNPATAEVFTMIFDRAREGKKALDSDTWLFRPSEKTTTTDDEKSVQIRSKKKGVCCCCWRICG